MNLRLRRRHRVAIAILAVALPLILWWAARTRRSVPIVDRLPEAAAAEGAGR